MFSSQGNLLEEELGSSGSTLVDYVTGVCMELEYQPGTRMQHVDACSWNPVNVCMVSILSPTARWQGKGNYHGLKGLKADYMVQDERLYWRTLLGIRLYVPAMARFNLVRAAAAVLGFTILLTSQAISVAFYSKCEKSD